MGIERLNMPKKMMPGHELRLLTLNGSGWSNLSLLRLIKTVDLDLSKRPYNHFNIIGGIRMGRYHIMPLWKDGLKLIWI